MSSRPPAAGVFEMGDVFAAAEHASFALSPDGRFLAVARVEYVRGAGRFSRVVVLALDEGEPARPAPEIVVFTGDCDGWSPDFADDGAGLLFLTDVAGEARPWIATGRNAT